VEDSVVTSLFFGNLQENRIGPEEIPVTLTTALDAAEPLRFTNVLLANRSSVPITVTVHVVPVGSVASDATKVVPDVNVPPNDNIVFVFEIPLNMNDLIQYVASDAGVNFIGTISRRHR